MNKLMQKISRFMYGRYGADETYYFLILLSFVLAFSGVFFGGLVKLVIMIAEIFLLIVATFRFLSRNISKRQKENIPVRKAFGKIKNEITLSKNKKRDKNTHVYKKCIKCSAVLRLPRISGEHTATCPKCGSKIKVKVK